MLAALHLRRQASAVVVSSRLHSFDDADGPVWEEGEVDDLPEFGAPPLGSASMEGDKGERHLTGIERFEDD